MTLSTLEAQLADFDHYALRMYARELHLLRNPDYRQMVIARARERLIEGFDLYGETMYHRTYADLCAASLEEHADGMVNYPLGRHAQGWT